MTSKSLKINIDTKSLWKEVNDLHSEFKKGKSIKFLKKKYSNILAERPSIFEMAIKNDFNLNRLQFMLRKVDQINNSEVDQYTASADVSTELAKEYIFPITNELDKKKKDLNKQ